MLINDILAQIAQETTDSFHPYNLCQKVQLDRQNRFNQYLIMETVEMTATLKVTRSRASRAFTRQILRQTRSESSELNQFLQFALLFSI